MLGNIAGNVADKGLLNKLGDYIDKKINQYYDGQSQSAKPLEYVTTSDTLKSSEQGQSKVGHAETDTLKSSEQGQSNENKSLGQGQSNENKSLGQGQSNGNKSLGQGQSNGNKSLGQGQSNGNRVVFNSPKSPVRSKNRKTRYIDNQNQNLDSVEYKEKTEKKL
ncbi:MAG: hypothetical protein Q8747_01925 [Candidatus Phytoplasma australasiaticum]|nr:hypothetical protein [Candidatus Phytoplasma australasiaticum]